MAFVGPAVSDGQINMVVDVTGLTDRSMITNALRANQGDVSSVVLEFVEDQDKVAWPLPGSLAQLVRADVIAV